MTELSRRHVWQLVLINAIWGFNIVAIKLCVDRFPPVFLSFLRFLMLASRSGPGCASGAGKCAGC